VSADCGDSGQARAAYAEQVLELVQRALECCHGTHTLADVRREIEANRLELWVAGEGRAVAVTEFVNYPAGRVLNIFLSAGDHIVMNECLPGLEAYARGKGCMAVMFYGRAPRRAAWSALLPGYRPAWVCMWKDL
jgi:hypothetical protein